MSMALSISFTGGWMGAWEEGWWIGWELVYRVHLLPLVGDGLCFAFFSLMIISKQQNGDVWNDDDDAVGVLSCSGFFSYSFFCCFQGPGRVLFCCCCNI